jgi:hypothetical protein
LTSALFLFYLCSLIDLEKDMTSVYLDDASRTPGLAHCFAEPAPPDPLEIWEEENAHGSALAALAGTQLASRFCSWTGRSGRRYVFSVYSPAACPAFCNALLLVAVRDSSDRLRVVSMGDTGAFPEQAIAQAKRKSKRLEFEAGLEFQIHLLSASRAGREAAAADLAHASARPNAQDSY